MKKFIISTIVFIVLLSFCVKVSDMTDKRQADEKAYLETLREEDKIGYFIKKELKGKVSTGKNKLGAYHVKSTDNGYEVIVGLNANEYLTESEIMKWIENEMSSIYLMLFKSEYDIAYVRVYANFPIMDEYGNIKDQTLRYTRIDKETARKINWNQDDSILKYQILPNIWQEY